MPRLSHVLLALLLLRPLPVAADDALVAVASNFAPVAERLARDYRSASGNEILVTGGATGKLFAQITAGAPFDVLLSADRTTPLALADRGLADRATQFTYARGALALWSADPARDLSDPAAALRAASHVAIANPDLAPYGRAALEIIARLGLTDEIASKIVTGQNIGQAQTMVAAGAADVGFVSASAVHGTPAGAVWRVPDKMHAPIEQDAVLLEHGRANAAARGFLDYLGTDEARATIAAAGYILP